MPVVIAAICMALMLRALPVAAQAPGAAVSSPSVTLSPPTATVGDQLTLTITVEHDAGVSVTAPGFGANLGGLELVSKAPPATTDSAADRSQTTFSYTLTAFSTGTFTVPALVLDYASQAGSTGTVATEATTVTISSVVTADDTDLRPLKPQLSLDSGAPSPAAPVIFVAVFALLTAAGYGLHRRAAERVTMGRRYAVSVALAPHEAARTALDALALSGLAATDPDEYYARLAATVRWYLSGRFGFAAYAMTRSELEREMRRAGIDPWPARLASNVLAEADAVQFASFRPALERRDADLTAAYEIIELTSDSPPPAPPHGETLRPA
ncbi:MAG: BatD family protein [Chloroflexota bacterium]|nr:BatD family protein [Chloroflexota bacterium]